ncbi:MAG: hypothetical protein KGL39_31610 [Patescibacteria group bacterium]|nr:hypothetical protein [Patescibacteria group bacterium]
MSADETTGAVHETGGLDETPEAFWQRLIAGAEANGLNLGSGHWLRWMSSMQGEKRIGGTIIHPAGPNATSEGGYCMGGVMFAGTQYAQDHADEHAFWQVTSYEPLTISPSVLCGCGDHGFIRDGKWVPA